VIPVFALVVAPGGFMGQPLANGANMKEDLSGDKVKLGFNTVPELVAGLNARSSYGRTVSPNSPRPTLDRPIVDETGITGNYALQGTAHPVHAGSEPVNSKPRPAGKQPRH
jgi:hypothetical protein